MKLIMAIVNGEDSKEVIKQLMFGGFQVTKLASSGGFLRAKNVTLLCGVTNERVNACLEIIKNTCSAKKYSYKNMTTESSSISKISDINKSNELLPLTGEIVFGGATVFVLNIEDTKKY